MDENTNPTPSPSEPKSSTGMIIAGVVGVVVIIAIIIGLTNRSLIDQITGQVAQTQDQVQDVDDQAAEMNQELRDEMREGAREVAESIGDINNPLVRLGLAKAYAEKLKAALTPASQEDLNVVLVYVEENPEVLVKPPATWPAEVQEAITNLKSRLASVRASVATSVADAKEAVSEKVNDLLTLTGTLEFVSDDSTLGGSVFVMTTSEGGRKYFFEFSSATSEQIKNTMLGKEVSIRVKVTGIENGHVIYDVVSGPTLVTPTPAAATDSGAMTQ